MVPVGPETLGRIMNVIGEGIDDRGDIQTSMKMSIHRDSPLLVDQNTGNDL